MLVLPTDKYKTEYYFWRWLNPFFLRFLKSKFIEAFILKSRFFKCFVSNFFFGAGAGRNRDFLGGAGAEKRRNLEPGKMARLRNTAKKVKSTNNYLDIIVSTVYCAVFILGVMNFVTFSWKKKNFREAIYMIYLKGKNQCCGSGSDIKIVFANSDPCPKSYFTESCQYTLIEFCSLQVKICFFYWNFK